MRGERSSIADPLPTTLVGVCPRKSLDALRCSALYPSVGKISVEVTRLFADRRLGCQLIRAQAEHYLFGFNGHSDNSHEVSVRGCSPDLKEFIEAAPGTTSGVPRLAQQLIAAVESNESLREQMEGYEQFSNVRPSIARDLLPN
jgi:hypothetical protein